MMNILIPPCTVRHHIPEVVADGFVGELRYTR